MPRLYRFWREIPSLRMREFRVVRFRPSLGGGTVGTSDHAVTLSQRVHYVFPFGCFEGNDGGASLLGQRTDFLRSHTRGRAILCDIKSIGIASRRAHAS